MPVNTERVDFVDMKPKWKRLRDCYDGRDSVLKAGALYVPNLPGIADMEKNNEYRARGNFYNAVKQTVKGMVGSIFQKSPEVEFPESIKTYLDDITLANVPFETFAQETGREVMLVSRYGVLVDMPIAAATSAPSVLVTEARPYCVAYKAEDIVNWKTKRIRGDDILTMVVLRETIEEPDLKDPFIIEIKTQYRVLTLTDAGCTVQLWREKSKDQREFITFGSLVTLTRRGIPLPFIPFIFIGSTAVTPELEPPPLLDLADVNLGHWRNSVDHEYGLHLVALPTPWVSGAKSSGSPTEPMKIGPSVVWELDINGTAGMLEFGGEGLESLVKAMDKKEKHMATLGARLLEQGATVPETASAVRMRHAGEHASLRSVAQTVELGLGMVLQIVAWWVGTEEQPSDTEVSVELNKDFFNIKISSQDVTAALASLQAEKISFETWWNILMTGGWGREGIDADKELEDIDKRLEDEPPTPEPKPGTIPAPTPQPGGEV